MRLAKTMFCVVPYFWHLKGPCVFCDFVIGLKRNVCSVVCFRCGIMGRHQSEIKMDVANENYSFCRGQCNGTLSMLALQANSQAEAGHDVHVCYLARPETPQIYSHFCAEVKLIEVPLLGVAMF